MTELSFGFKGGYNLESSSVSGELRPLEVGILQFYFSYCYFFLLISISYLVLFLILYYISLNYGRLTIGGWNWPFSRSTSFEDLGLSQNDSVFYLAPSRTQYISKISHVVTNIIVLIF